MNKLMKKSVLLILTLLVLLAVGSVAAYAAITPAQPDGDGTEADPYKIGTVEELYWFAGLVNGTLTDEDDSAIAADTDACAVLTENIELNSGTFDKEGNYNPKESETPDLWTPIGNGSNRYTGTFDGDGHTISGVYINAPGANNQGLFGSLAAGGTIKNVKMKSGYIEANYFAGAFVGYNYGGTIQDCDNLGCFVYGETGLGGIAGYNSGVIDGCKNTAVITGAADKSEGYIGGITGSNSSDAVVKNCINTGKISSGSSYAYAGGIVGTNFSQVLSCVNEGEVSGSGDYASIGGIGGMNYYLIKDCINYADIIGNMACAGGIAGYNRNNDLAENVVDSEVNNCYSTGDVISADFVAGGIIGYHFAGTAKNSYSTGNVEGFRKDDGIVGYYYAGNGSKAENCFFNSDNNPEGKAGEGVTARTTAEFSSGEVAWLLNDGQDQPAWGQGSNNMPVLKDKLPDGVTAITPVRITIVMPNESESYGYATLGNVLAEYPQGYKFYEDEDYKNLIDTAERTYSADTTIYAKKQSSGIVPQKTLTFDTNGGSEIDSVTENYGKTIVLADYTPKRDGYKFVGWYKDKELEEKIDYAILDYDMTVYAKWEKIEETVDYDTMIVLTVNDKTAIVNGKAIENDVAPLIVNSRTYTPARFVAESLGAKVVWDEKSKTVTITKDETTIILVIDSTTAYVNGKAVKMDASAFIADGRTFTPARFVAENLGASVEWDEEVRTVTIIK